MLVLSGLIGAIAGAAITFFFNMWKFHRDERSSRCDELCKSIHDAAVLAADYWFDDYTTKPQEIAEAKLYAAQILIDGQFSSFRLYLRREDEAGIDHLLSGFYDALTGARPYSTSGPLAAAVDRIRSAVPAAPSRTHKGLSPDVDAIVLRCLAKAPSDRYDTAAAVARDLRNYMRAVPW